VIRVEVPAGWEEAIGAGRQAYLRRPERRERGISEGIPDGGGGGGEDR